ncbi:hypothetical protein ACWGSK_19160 [Nocardiopsis sp. NPDC055551]|uniref:hypothetical protein n=1 Tax=Nocardiopsis sp. NPDC006832 TaxID=3157188 RepID=UPI0033DFCB02
MEFRLEDGGYQEIGQSQGEELFETDSPFPMRLIPHWLVASGPWRERIGGAPPTE